MKTLILIFAWCSLAVAQNKGVDSLSGALKKASSDIEKTKILNLLADAHKNSNPKQAEQFAKSAFDISKKIGDKIQNGFALLNLGNAEIIKTDYKKALDYFAQAQFIFESQNQSGANLKDIQKGLAKAYSGIGIVFSEKNNYTKALEYYLKALPIIEKLNDKENTANLYNNIGVVYMSKESNYKALEFFSKAQKIQEQLHLDNSGTTYTNIANIYVALEDNTKALEYYNKAKNAIDKSQDQRALGEWYNNMGVFYYNADDTTKVFDYWNNAIKVFNAIDDKFGLYNTYYYYAQYYFDTNDYNNTIKYANQALNLGKQTEVLEHQLQAYKLLSDCYQKQNNMAVALQNYIQYNQIKDSLINQESIAKAVEIELNYEFDKKEALHKKELEAKEVIINEQNKRNVIQIIFSLLFGLLLCGIVFLAYNRIQLKKRLTLQKELAEYEQKALHLQMNPHFVFNCLGSISSFIVNNGTDSALKYLAKFSKLMRLTLEYSKETLIPLDKEIDSLQNYLELEQLRFNHKFSFVIKKETQIDDDTALPPLLLQPFVENAIIHGIIPSKNNGFVEIKFSIENDSLVCIITDNGIGIKKSTEIKQNSMTVHQSRALEISKKRLSMIENTTGKKTNLEILELYDKTTNATGTQVILNLPLQYIITKKI